MMKVHLSKKLKRLFSFALAVILCVPMCVVPLPVHAAKSASLPDTLTPEMAAAFANQLSETESSYGGTLYAVIETLGPDKYPVLRIIEDMEIASEESIWLFNNGRLENVYWNMNQGGSDDSGEFFISVVNGIDYYGFCHYSRNYDYYSEEYEIYTVESGKWKETIQFSNDFSATINGETFSISEAEYNQYATQYTGTPSGNTLLAPNDLYSALQVFMTTDNKSNQNVPVTPNSDDPFELLTPEMAKAYGEKLEELLMSVSVTSASIETVEGAPVLRTLDYQYETNAEEEIWVYRSGALQLLNLSYSLGEAPKEIPWEDYEEAGRIIGQEIEESARLAAQLKWIGLNMKSYAQLKDVLDSVDAERLADAEDRVSSFARPYEENYEFDSTQLVNGDLADMALGMLAGEGENITKTFEDISNDNFYAFRVGAPCREIQTELMRIVGRTVDFAPYTLDHMPQPGEVDDFQLFVYNDVAYIISYETYEYSTFDAAFLEMYDLGNGIFIAPAYIIETEYGYYLHGPYISVFHKNEQDYQLLKIYPLNKFPSVDEINHYAIKVNPESNFKIDYSAISKYTDLSQYVEALKTALAAANSLNDAGNRAVTDYIDFVIQNYAPATISANENSAIISPETVKAAQSSASEAKVALMDAIGGLALSRTLTLTARIDVSGLDLTSPVRVRLPEDAVAAVSDLDALTLVLSDNQHMITIPADGLRQIGYLDVQLEQAGQNQYSISFFDQSEQVIDHLSTNISFTLPAPSELASVQALCNGYSDNWGGQYDGQNKTITFQTPYTGEYTVLETTVQISDIDYLSDEMKRAILFMVSKGYFELDSEGRFNPSVGLNRYEFSQSSVKIFFALNREAVTTFPDVANDSPYYPYVASGEEQEILRGYDDGTFRGEDDILRVQMLAICGRTLVNKKGYSRPEDPSVYLNYVDAASIPEWSASDLALTIREGLIESGSALRPNQAINRGEAALILYRLFMLLYEVSPTPITIVETSSAPTNTASSGAISPTVIGGIAVVGVGAVGGAAYYILGKKKLLKK